MMGRIRGAQVSVIDYERPEANDWLAVNQLTVTENKNTRRPDVVLFVNGLPLGVIELKNPADEDATIWTAWQQLQTYKAELPALFSMNELLVASDGTQARIGTLTAGREWFKPWRTISGEELADPRLTELQVMLEGVCSPQRLLPLVRDFIVFEDDGGGAPVKKMAGYHQLHAVRTAVAETVRATEVQREAQAVAEERGRYESGRRRGGKPGDRRIGVVWHTQGSGKSLTMAFYGGAIIREPAMENPTIVVLTDRNDLDDQLFGTFSRCQDLLRQPPTQAESRADLRSKLSVGSGGVVFTTIQKFFPEERGDTHPALSQRRNIVVIADEAHRSQYDFVDGFARHMRDALPNASFVGFTGTPIELQDANTRAVFGDYISIYDIQRAVKDGATVPIYYESRLAKLALDESEKPAIDPEFEEATEGEEVERREKLKTRWAQLEAIVGAEKRLKLVAEDIAAHFDQRLESLDGKAMVVCMSRRICIGLYAELVRLRPDWHHRDDGQGSIKVVMTGAASDPPDWQQHIGNKARREALAKRFRDAADPLRIVLVRDMWLTGFDAPSLHTMYVDKPMRGHGLMQAIARVNRVFKDKPGGLVVDYLGLAHELKRALAAYTESGGTGQTALDQDEAVAVMIEKYEVCCGLFYGFDWAKWTGGAPADRLNLLPAAQRAHPWPRKTARDRCIRAVRELSQAFALAVPHEETYRIRDDVSFFQTVQAGLAKRAPGDARPQEELDHAVRQIVSRAVASEGVMGHLRRRGPQQAGHLGAVQRVSRRGAGNAPPQPCRGAAAEAAQGRAGHPKAQERRPGPVICRAAGADPPTVPEPGDRGGAGHRRAGPAGEGHERSQRPWRTAGAVRGRAGLLRRAGDQRQRRSGPRRRYAARHRPRAGGDRAAQRHHRLDPPRERARPAPRAGQARPAQARLPARQAGKGGADGPRTGGGPIGRVGGSLNRPGG